MTRPVTRPLTEQQRWLLDLLGDDPDRFVAIRVNVFSPGIVNDYLLVTTRAGGNTIRPRESERLLRPRIDSTIHSLVMRRKLTSVGHVEDHGELFGVMS